MTVPKRLLALGATLFSASAGWAGTVTYQYSGNDFDVIAGTITAGMVDHISGSVTFAGPLVPMSFYTSSDLTAWNFFDGQVALSSAANSLQQAMFWTGSSGEIQYWYLEPWTSRSTPFPIFNIVNESSGSVRDVSAAGMWDYAAVYAAGRWSPLEPAAAPESTTLMLVLLGSACVLSGHVSRRWLGR